MLYLLLQNILVQRLVLRCVIYLLVFWHAHQGLMVATISSPNNVTAGDHGGALKFELYY